VTELSRDGLELPQGRERRFTKFESTLTVVVKRMTRKAGRGGEKSVVNPVWGGVFARPVIWACEENDGGYTRRYGWKEGSPVQEWGENVTLRLQGCVLC